MHGRSLTKSIRFKVTSEVNVSRVKKELGPRVLRFRHMEWILRMWRH